MNQMSVITIANPQPTRLVIGCKEMAEWAFGVLARHYKAELQHGQPTPARSDEEKERAQWFLAQAMEADVEGARRTFDSLTFSRAS